MARAGDRRDSRLEVARYRQGETEPARRPEPQTADEESQTGAQAALEQVSQFVEISIAQAIRRGEFDDLPGAGKPLAHLTQTHDPDWWIRRKIERERLTGLGPPALTLRTEDAELDDSLDALGSERGVREVLEDFNRRVVEARRQLQGGPPVVTPTRDVDAEIVAWNRRRVDRREAQTEQRDREAAELAAMTRRQRRRAKRDRARS